MSDPRTPSSLARSRSGWSAGSDQSELAYLFYEHLIASRDRLKGLPPTVPADLETVERAIFEVVMHLAKASAPPTGILPLKGGGWAQLSRAAKDRGLDLYLATVALLAIKLSDGARQARHTAGQLEAVRGALDQLTFDYRRPKRQTVVLLRALKTEMDSRIAYLRGLREDSFRFDALPELYRERRDKREKPDVFFKRVYGRHVRLGLTQADIRKVDPAYYNVLHVWCSRNGKHMGSFVPPKRQSRDTAL